MAKKTAPLLPSSAELLRHFGNRLRLARLRRRLTAKQVAERAGMAPMTLRSVERGGSGVTMGAYLAVMQVLGIDEDLDLLAKTDPMGRALQDARLPGSAKRVRKRLEPAGAPAKRPKKALAPSPDPNRSEKSGFASSKALADLIKPSTRPAEKKR
jgi:transcriptional regulator with XRE-family HTH domain